MLRIVLLCSLLSFGIPAQAEAYNRVDFQVEAAREVANDLLVTSLSADIQDKQPSHVAQQLNTILNGALRLSASFAAVKTRSGNQRTYPVYGKNNQISAWRGHGEIQLESRDFKAAGELIMQLQTTLQLGSVEFTIAPDTRTRIEDELISEAIKAFQHRAAAIQAAVGAKSYKIVHFAINSGGMPPVYPAQMMRSSALADSAIPAPEFAGGDTRMTAQINGTIELQ